MGRGGLRRAEEGRAGRGGQRAKEGRAENRWAAECRGGQRAEEGRAGRAGQRTEEGRAGQRRAQQGTAGHPARSSLGDLSALAILRQRRLPGSRENSRFSFGLKAQGQRTEIGASHCCAFVQLVTSIYQPTEISK